MIVVDASLAVKWLVREPDSDRADRLFDAQAGELCGPDLLVIEVSRALVAAANARRIAPTAARNALTAWFDRLDGAIILHPCDSRLIDRATTLALDLGHPLADCVYLVLAIDLGVDLVTCDARFHARAASQFSMIKLLADDAS